MAKVNIYRTEEGTHVAVELETDDFAEAQAWIEWLNGDDKQLQAEEPEPPKKRGRKKKADKEPEPAKAEGVDEMGNPVKPEPEPQPEPEPEPARVYKIDDVRAAMHECISLNAGKKMVEILEKEFGAAKVSELSEDKYGEYVEALQGLIEKAKKEQADGGSVLG